MNVLPDYVASWFAENGGEWEATPLGGGDSNHVAIVRTHGQNYIAKWKPNAPPGFFSCEAEGLLALRQTQTLRVPDVVAVGDFSTPYLVLEYLPECQPTDPQLFTRRFAEGLAALHRHEEHDKRFGWAADNFLGSQPQPNTWHDHWPSFYRDCRLVPQIEKARGRGLLPPHREQALAQVLEQLDRLLDYPARPSLIHGDLWSGNFLSIVGDEAALIDPAIHYADREVELAFVELFGGFPQGFVQAYHNVFPPEPGYAQRRPVHQLYPLLVHLNHFGETYGPGVDRACRDALR